MGVGGGWILVLEGPRLSVEGGRKLLFKIKSELRDDEKQEGEGGGGGKEGGLSTMGGSTVGSPKNI